MAQRSRWRSASVYTVLNQKEYLIAVVRDITERKRAEEERLAHLRFFESMDKVNRAIQGTSDLEQMMSDVLGAVLSIFDCDRAWLLYPCDPDAPSFRVPMEITRPEYPGAKVLNVDVPMSPGEAQNLREALESDAPVTYTAGTERPIATAAQFGVQSQMFVAVYPKLGKPWVFGLHQCSYPRVWTPEEKQLFQEIGRRLSDALTSLLAYRELRESEDRYRRITEGLTDYQYSVRVENGRAVETTQSPACVTVTGYTPEEFAADPYLWFRMVVPEDRELVRERVQQILAGKEVAPIEHRILRKDGEVRWVCDTTILFKDASGKLLSYDGVIKDITERKRAEEVLQNSQERVQALYDSITDALFVHGLEPDGSGRRFLEVNEVACRRLGYTRAELLTMSPADIDARDPSVDLGPIIEQVAAGKTVIFEQTHVAKDGSRIPVEISARRFTLEGRPAVFSLVRDITERKRTEAALRESEARFRALFENSPVPIWEEDFSAVKSLLDGLKEKGVGDVEAYLRQHPEAGQQCAGLVRITDVNQAAVAMHEANSKEELLKGLVPDLHPGVLCRIPTRAGWHLQRGTRDGAGKCRSDPEWEAAASNRVLLAGPRLRTCACQASGFRD